MGEKQRNKRGKELCSENLQLPYFQCAARPNRRLADLQLDGLGNRFAGSISDGKGVSGCFLGRKFEAPVMRGPNLASSRIERDGLGIGNVVAQLCGFTPTDDGGRNVKSVNGKFGTAQLFDGGTITGALLFSGFFRVAAFQFAIGFVS